MTIKQNIKYLKSLAKLVAPTNRVKAEEIAKMYEDRKIRVVDTAINTINDLRKGGDKGEMSYISVISKYGQRMTKTETIEAIKEVKQYNVKRDKAASKIGKVLLKRREITSSVLKSIDIKNRDKAKSSINMNLGLQPAFKRMPSTDENYEKVIIDYNFENGAPHPDTMFLNIQDTVYSMMLRQVLKILKEKSSIKINCGMYVIYYWFEYDTKDKKYEYMEVKMHVNSKAIEINKHNVNKVLLATMNKLRVQIHENQKMIGSNWKIKQLKYAYIDIYKTIPLRGSSYIPTPEPFNNSRCGLINIQNDDLECFKWCMKYHQSKKDKHDDRISVLSKIEDKYNYDNVNFPASMDDIKIFEENNQLTIFVYAFEYDEDSKLKRDKEGKLIINRCYMGSCEYMFNDIIYLLLIENEGKSHYVYIKHISRFLNLSKQVGDNHKMFCPICQKSVDMETWKSHISSCYKFGLNGTLIKLPEANTFMEFNNYKNKIERPFMIYADTECTLAKTKNNSNIIHEHHINSCCFYFVCTFDNSRNKLETFVGENCLEEMITEMKQYAKECIEEMREEMDMSLSFEEEMQFRKAKFCHICGCDGFEDKGKYMKVKDHDHRTGEFIGAAHLKCNINYFSNRYLPVVFHNLRGYDGHLIIKKARDLFNDEKISVIPNTYEKYMSFKIGNLKFIDSFQFMSSSLEKLVENLIDNKSDNKYCNFNGMLREFPDNLDILCRKGFYPYEWMDSTDKFYVEGLPPKESFFSQLSNKGISDKDYEHAQHVYKTMECENFLDYHMLYLKTDVVLLADVFENFRKTCINYYDLDPANYISAPSLAWDAMLLKTGISLEQISDMKILDIVERQKRGGLCFVGSKRYVKANNHYLEDFDKTKPENYLVYLDANNLYGWAMSQPLPYAGLKLVDIELSEVLKTPDDDKYGYIVEIDLEFPKEIHDKLKEYPPCPENISPDAEWLGEYQHEIIKLNNTKYNSCPKLVPHLYKHEKYCIHYRNLKFISELGVKLGKVHNIVRFRQKPWLKTYIDFNTVKRTQAKNEFEKDFFKLMNNAVFGKTMENVKNRMDLYITTSEDKAMKWFSKINFKDSKSYDGLYLIEMYKKEIVYDKPIYVGTSILDLSKLHMMDFHYNVIQKEFENQYNLIYSDTDSLVYNIYTNDLYKWIGEHKQYFDLSESVRPELVDNTNKKVLGKFKDEMNSLIIKEFLALNPKVYSINCSTSLDNIETKCKKTLKGVSRAVVRDEITYSDYDSVLSSGYSQNRNVIGIRSINHQLITLKTNKIALTSFYDKMKMLNNIDCVPFGFEG